MVSIGAMYTLGSGFPVDEIEGCTDEKLARFERIIMEKKRRVAGRGAAPTIAALIVTEPSFDVRVCIEESTEGNGWYGS